MRKRFWKKQWIAVAMASSMVFSAVNMPVRQDFVQAAESGNIFYSNEAKIETGALKLPEEDWGDNKPIIAYDESVKDVNITKNFTMTADVYLDENGYNSLAEEGDYLKLKGLSLIHMSEPTRLLSISYAVFCLKKKNRVIELGTQVAI